MRRWTMLGVVTVAFVLEAGAILRATETYAAPWLVLAAVAVGAAFTLAQVRPLVQREAPRPERVVEPGGIVEPQTRISTGGRTA